MVFFLNRSTIIFRKVTSICSLPFSSPTRNGSLISFWRAHLYYYTTILTIVSFMKPPSLIRNRPAVSYRAIPHVWRSIARNNRRRWIKATVKHIRDEIKQDQYIRFQSTTAVGRVPKWKYLSFGEPSSSSIRWSTVSIMHRCLCMPEIWGFILEPALIIFALIIMRYTWYTFYLKSIEFRMQVSWK